MEKTPKDPSASGGVLWKSMFLKISQNSHGNICARVSFLKKLQAKRDFGTGVFCCEFCEILKNTFFTEHLWTTATKLLKGSSLKKTYSIPRFLQKLYLRCLTGFWLRLLSGDKIDQRFLFSIAMFLILLFDNFQIFC